MSIATEITRLQGAKTNIKKAVQSKGVSIPSSATLDGYPTYISQINADLLESVPDYFRGVTQQAVQHVDDLGSGYIHHIIVTDLHYNINQRHSASIANYLMSTGKFDKLMLLGDLTDGNTDAQYANFIDDGWSQNNGDIILCWGNHDSTSEGTSGHKSKSDYYADFLSDASYAEGAGSTLYYYYDDSTNKIRYIVLNTESWTAAQKSFLEDAVDLDNTWTIFVLSHRNININMHEEMATYVNISQETSEEIIGIIASSSAQIGGMVCGHQHVDCIDLTNNEWYQIALTCDRFTTRTAPRRTMEEGQITEQALTIWSIKPSTGDMEFWRIGCYDNYNDVSVNYKTNVTDYDEYDWSVGNLGTELVDFTDNSSWTIGSAAYTVTAISETKIEVDNTGGGNHSGDFTITGVSAGTYYYDMTQTTSSGITLAVNGTTVFSKKTTDWSGFITIGADNSTVVMTFYTNSSTSPHVEFTTSIRPLTGRDAVITPLSVTANGTYSVPSGTDGYNPVVVNVPAGITPTGSLSITSNDTYDVTNYASVVVLVPSGYSIDDVADHNYSGAITVSTAEVVRDYTFANSSITSFTSDSVKDIYSGAFRNCTSLTSVNLSELTSFHNSATYMFAGSTSLTSVYMPKLTSTSSNTYVFSGCTSLVTVDLGSMKQFYNNFFPNCSALRTLVLRRSDAICSTGWMNANVFGGIYDNPSQSTIYVPNALISTYQSASNWSTLYGLNNNIFQKIEGSAYDLS